MNEGVPGHRDAPASESGIRLGQAQYLYSLPEGQRLRHLHEDQDHKAPCRKRTGGDILREEYSVT